MQRRLEVGPPKFTTRVFYYVCKHTCNCRISRTPQGCYPFVKRVEQDFTGTMATKAADLRRTPSTIAPSRVVGP